MKKNQTCFEVAVTPPQKRKPPLEPSPVLLLQKFKGSPSLSFKDVKVGSSACKGFWAENPNGCTVTVVLSKLPPAERGLDFSESEFVLEPGACRRIEVKWSPASEGSWRDIVQVQVWGTPPPHLNFRVIIHLTSVLPKIQKKCCHMAPLRSQNIKSSKVQEASTKSNAQSGCRHSHPPLKVGNGKGKENIVKKEPVIIIDKKMSKKQKAIERESLENTPHGLRIFDFAPIEDDCFPPCDVPSTPLRRNTFCIDGDKTASVSSSKRSHAAPFPGTAVEETKNIPVGSTPLQRPKLKCMQVPPLSPIPSVSQECRAEVSVNTTAGYKVTEQKHFAEMTTYVNINHTFIQDSSSEFDVEEAIRKACSLVQKNWRRVQEEMKKEIGEGQRPAVLEKACVVIQRNWRLFMARKKARKVRAEMWMLMHRACCIIQRNWRYYMARKLARKNRAVIWYCMNEASSTIQRNYRLYLARKKARKDRAVMWQQMHEASSTIQRNFRLYLARKKARKHRAVMWQQMHQASSIIQRNFRLYLARKKARRDRAVMWQQMHQASSIIQRNFRLYLARKKARKDKAVMWQQMHEASSIIQRNFRLYLARKKARKDRAVMWQQMHEASSIIQRNFRLYLARRKARENRAVMWQRIIEASSVIQRNWRLALARKIAARERTEMWMQMHDACYVIQKSWRSYVARKQAARERAEILASIKRNYEYFNDKNKEEDTVNPKKCLFELLEKFHLKPRAYELLFELADLHPSEDLLPALKHIQSSIRNRELKSKKSILMCNKATQTLLNGEFERPVTRSQTNVSNAKSSSKIVARRSLLDSQHRKSLTAPTAAFLTPLTTSRKQRDIPEKERWSCVAEAVGRLHFTPH